MLIKNLPTLLKEISKSNNLSKTLESYKGLDWNNIKYKICDYNFNKYTIRKFCNESKLQLLVQGKKSYIPINTNGYILPLDNKVQVLDIKKSVIVEENCATKLTNKNVILNNTNKTVISLLYTE